MFCEDLLDTFKKLNFARVLSTDFSNDFVTQRMEALQKFESSSDAEYVLFLNSSVILHNHDTLNVLVNQKQDVMAPMVKVNVFKPSYKQIISQVAYDENVVVRIKFPYDSKSLIHQWLIDRYYVC